MNDVARLRPNSPSAANMLPKGQQRTVPRELHPAAMEAAAVYSDALATVEILNSEKKELEIQVESGLRHIRTVEETSQREIKRLEQRLEQETALKEKFQRAAISLLTGYGNVISVMTEVREAALRASEVAGVDPPNSLEQDLAQIVKTSHPRDLDRKANP